MISARPGRLTDDERARLAATMRTEYEAGAGIRQLADKHGHSYAWTRKMLTDAGTTLRARGYAGRLQTAAARGGEC
jgi:hypothetical protein